MTLQIQTIGVDETVMLGNSIGSLLQPGDVIALTGQLGAGKTHMVKGIAGGMGIHDTSVVTSPSYVLMNSYMGRLPLYHFDAYRLESPDEMYDIDCMEFFWGDGVSVIEWADKVTECLPDEHVRITIRTISQAERSILVSYCGKRYRDFMKDLRMMFNG
ncbi:MAG: tRNA (adenosine(37)-N6)-threonylcarbamoyltransferase complex ATPase subunit type 1 TsaE [Planctomycetes bacterium]|nr:tRNA (adenosine(37)-N6)-threonylcarbamoyltransferase complex ATPase subunit type 1 TsaE [Planctomycetota bacterium]